MTTVRERAHVPVQGAVPSWVHHRYPARTRSVEVDQRGHRWLVVHDDVGIAHVELAESGRPR